MRSILLAFLLALSPVAIGAADAQSPQKAPAPPKAPPFAHPAERQKANENLVMVMGGSLGGPWTQLAQEIAQTVSDGDNLRVLPLGGSGSGKGNLRDILLLRGVDLSITRLEVLNEVKRTGELGPNLERRIAYVAPLMVDMLHVLVRPEINSLKDLNGQKVSLWPAGSVIPGLLAKLGVRVDEVNLSIPDTLEGMRTGKLKGFGCVCVVPIPALRGLSPDLGYKLLEVPYLDEFEESYLPASLSSEVYPNQIQKDTKVRTIGANILLVSYNWPHGSERYAKIDKFVKAFFANIDKLRQPPRHPGWKDVNIHASIRGWQRFPAAQEWIDKQNAEATLKAKATASGVDVTQARAQAAKVAPHDAAEQERLFKEFIEWSRQRPKK